jgi:hypothetical protein
MQNNHFGGKEVNRKSDESEDTDLDGVNADLFKDELLSDSESDNLDTDKEYVDKNNLYLTEIPQEISNDTSLLSSFFEEMYVNHNPESSHIKKALDTVLRYIIDNKLILSGGMALDYALRKKDKKLYDTEKIDYDFCSWDFHNDAYKISKLIHDNDPTNDTIQVINAIHTSTLRVRTKLVVVADCTYVPKNIYDILPIEKYENITIFRPFYQVLDQNLALSRPFANTPLENATGKRWKNDIVRFELITDAYDLASDLEDDIKKRKSNKDTFSYLDNGIIVDGELTKHTIDLSKYNDQCLAGYIAYAYWMNKYYQDTNGVNDNHIFDIKSGMLTYTAPKVSPITLYSDDFSSLIRGCSESTIKYYNAFLDKLPRQVIIDNSSNKDGDIVGKDGDILGKGDDILGKGGDNVGKGDDILGKGGDNVGKGDDILGKGGDNVGVSIQQVEIFDNLSNYTSAHKFDSGVYIIGIQSVIIYMAIRALFYNDKHAIEPYRNLINLVIESFKKNTSDYIYEMTYYGKSNQSANDTLLLKKQCALINKAKVEIGIPSHYQPKQNNAFPVFDPTKSNEYQFDALECNPFVQSNCPDVCISLMKK